MENTKKMFSIESDGTTIGTKVFDSDGKQVGLVQKIVWESSVDHPLAKATIEILNIPLYGSFTPEVKKVDVKEPVIKDVVSTTKKNSWVSDSEDLTIEELEKLVEKGNKLFNSEDDETEFLSEFKNLNMDAVCKQHRVRDFIRERYDSPDVVYSAFVKFLTSLSPTQLDAFLYDSKNKERFNDCKWYSLDKEALAKDERAQDWEKELLFLGNSIRYKVQYLKNTTPKQERATTTSGFVQIADGHNQFKQDPNPTTLPEDFFKKTQAEIEAKLKEEPTSQRPEINTQTFRHAENNPSWSRSTQEQK